MFCCCFFGWGEGGEEGGGRVCRVTGGGEEGHAEFDLKLGEETDPLPVSDP